MTLSLTHLSGAMQSIKGSGTKGLAPLKQRGLTCRVENLSQVAAWLRLTLPPQFFVAQGSPVALQ